MFEKVLIANRGEIAVRVMRACEDLGIETVAVYSDADKHGGHVRYADEAYNVGPARAADSYLDQAAIVETAQRAGADAIHPGYGFLAENAAFAERVEETDGITWVGPSSEAMERLGEKTKARQIMDEAGVPIVPGTTEPVGDAEEVRAFGAEHGYPVAIKAEGGGGGRGMKVVESADDVADQLESAKREGKAYFDNDSVYLERYLENPRHVEVQILADEHGNVRHLGDRDCSLQRRHQKVVEEGPSPALSDDLREQITAAARKGAAEADYTNAGTVEFLIEEDDREDDGRLGPETDFYFLEVNTRIQVEHTVTEEITGVDIVAEQLRVADGTELGFAQEDVILRGHAIEYRINAEDATKDFAPATGGSLQTFDPPGGIGVRMDDALRQGDDLVTDYDSMIAKLVVSGATREQCLARSRRALREFDLEGVVTIVPFHLAMLDREVFVDGTYTTNYIDEHLADDGDLVDAYERWGSARIEESGGASSQSRELAVEVDGRRYEVEIADAGGAPIAPKSTATGSSGGAPEASTDADTAGGSQTSGGSPDVAAGERAVTAEMQGTVLDVRVAEGEDVAAGDVLLVLESMKMENDIVADVGGTVTTVVISEGDSVDMGDTLVMID